MESRCYKFYTNIAITWHEGVEWCSSRNMKMLDIEDSSENSNIAEEIGREYGNYMVLREFCTLKCPNFIFF